MLLFIRASLPHMNNKYIMLYSSKTYFLELNLLILINKGFSNITIGY